MSRSTGCGEDDGGGCGGATGAISRGGDGGGVRGLLASHVTWWFMMSSGDLNVKLMCLLKDEGGRRQQGVEVRRAQVTKF